MMFCNCKKYCYRRKTTSEMTTSLSSLIYNICDRFCSYLCRKLRGYYYSDEEVSSWFYKLVSYKEQKEINCWTAHFFDKNLGKKKSEVFQTKFIKPKKMLYMIRVRKKDEILLHSPIGITDHVIHMILINKRQTI